MQLIIHVERLVPGRWIGVVLDRDLQTKQVGILSYSTTEKKAYRAAEKIALQLQAAEK